MKYAANRSRHGANGRALHARALAWSILGAALLVISGCGFHLRGAVELPEDVHAVVLSGGSAALHDEIRALLTGSQARVVNALADADAVLNLISESDDQRLLVVDPDTGSPREYEVVYSVAYGLQSVEGVPIVPPNTVRVVRDYVYDRDAIIGTSRELGVLRTEMRRDAALQIMRRLSSHR